MSVRQGKTHRSTHCSPRAMEGQYGGRMGMMYEPADLEGSGACIQGMALWVHWKVAVS